MAFLENLTCTIFFVEMEEVLTTTQDARGNGGFQNHEGGPNWNRVLPPYSKTKTWWRPVPMSPYPPARLHGEIGGIQNGSQRTETKKFGTRLNTKKGQLETDNFKIKCNLKTVAFFLVLYLFYFLIQYILLF